MIHFIIRYMILNSYLVLSSCVAICLGVLNLKRCLERTIAVPEYVKMCEIQISIVVILCSYSRRFVWKSSY